MAYEERTPEDDRFDQIIKMEGLNIQSFHQDPPLDLFPNAETYPQFFNQNLVNPNRVLKQFLNDPQSNIRVFYLQLLRLAFEVPTDSGYNHICLQNFKKIVFHPEFEILFTPDSQQQREIYNDFQFKKLFAQFISLLITASESQPPSIEQAIDQFPIIDIVLIHIIRSLLVSFNIKVAFDQKISTDLLFKELSSVLQLSLTSYGNCWKFEQSDMFCYEQKENEIYLAFIVQEYQSQETNNLQTIQSVQNEERQVQDSFRSGQQNNLAINNSNRIIVPSQNADEVQQESQGFQAQQTQNWASDFYHNDDTDAAAVNNQQTTIPINTLNIPNQTQNNLRVPTSNYQQTIKVNNQAKFEQKININKLPNKQTISQTNYYTNPKPIPEVNKVNSQPANKPYQYQPYPTNTQGYKNPQPYQQPAQAQPSYKNNNYHQPQKNYKNQYIPSERSYKPKYIQNPNIPYYQPSYSSPNPIANPIPNIPIGSQSNNTVEQSNIDLMFSKIDSTLNSIHNQLAASHNISRQNSSTYTNYGHNSQNFNVQSYDRNSLSYNSYQPPQPIYNHNASRQSFGSNPDGYNYQSRQISSPKVNQQIISSRYEPPKYEPISSRYKQERQRTHPQYSSITNTFNTQRQHHRYSSQINNQQQRSYPNNQPSHFESKYSSPPASQSFNYSSQITFQKSDYNNGFTPSDVLRLLRPEHRQNISRIKQVNDTPQVYSQAYQGPPSIVRAASNIETRTYGKSALFDDRPYSVNNKDNGNSRHLPNNSNQVYSSGLGSNPRSYGNYNLERNNPFYT